MNHPRAWRALFHLTGFGLVALMLNCGGGGGSTPPPPPAPVATSLTTSNATPVYGGTFTLTPVYSAGTGTLNNNLTCPATGVATSPITANWAGARVYTLTVTNSAGATATKSVTVTPQTVAVGAISPATVTRTVNTTTTFTTTVTGGALNTVTWSSTAGTWAGNVWTAPAAAGTVTITATSVDDPTKTATTTVTVVAVPVASLVTSNANPAFGDAFTLTPTYANGTGALNYGVFCGATNVPTTVIADWNGTRTYTLTVTNAAGLPATASVDVTPQTVAVGAITPSAPTRTVNSTTTFTATVTGGALNTVTWTASAGTWAGNVWTAPPTAGNVTITATSVDDPTKTATTTVTVVAAPEITSFAAAKGTITNGTGTSLSYAFTGGDGVITPGDIAVTTGGTTNVTPTVNTTYTLTVTNAAGDPVTATAPITVVPAATITVFTANGSASPITVAPGATVVLHAEYADGVGTLNQGLGSIATGSDVTTAPLTATTTFTLTVTNGANDPVTQSVTVNVVAPGAFTAAGSMSSPRSVPTATLLTDNSVLIAGGNSGGSLATADRYSAGVHTPTGVMSIGRYSHAATRLPDGTVLITGGYDSVSGLALDTAEIYDPTTGTFSPTGTMTAARQDHTATLLSNGLVLVAGGTDGVSIKGAELFDPGTGLFTALTGVNGWEPTRNRATHTATLLVDGRVLLAGGYRGAVWGTADVYDPIANTFTAVGDLGQIRWGHTATLLPDGKVLIAGGRNGLETIGAVLAGAELFDPVANTFTAVSTPMISTREWHAASLLPDGRVLIVGGDRDQTVPGGPLVYLSSAEIYDPVAGTFTATASMAATRINATATLVPTGPGTGFVLIAGGGATAATERFD